MAHKKPFLIVRYDDGITSMTLVYPPFDENNPESLHREVRYAFGKDSHGKGMITEAAGMYPKPSNVFGYSENKGDPLAPPKPVLLSDVKNAIAKEKVSEIHEDIRLDNSLAFRKYTTVDDGVDIRQAVDWGTLEKQYIVKPDYYNIAKRLMEGQEYAPLRQKLKSLYDEYHATLATKNQTTISEAHDKLFNTTQNDVQNILHSTFLLKGEEAKLFAEVFGDEYFFSFFRGQNNTFIPIRYKEIANHNCEKLLEIKEYRGGILNSGKLCHPKIAMTSSHDEVFHGTFVPLTQATLFYLPENLVFLPGSSIENTYSKLKTEIHTYMRSPACTDKEKAQKMLDTLDEVEENWKKISDKKEVVTHSSSSHITHASRHKSSK